ncbi:hypothetical protein [Arcticibacterium luteifluviistationis]|uniref:Uncharacterized protein n=1 Tax=Arcticibacterium luteifluviistationis TaxID=1784714 RepID=A0A2Z4GAR0_9BACT|nr:hypothetical protein [Arcticibacterium luteifluviistationis]AWV98306.1 hypothetical protein DJ013_09035 [Arcticibacterium luteifluviistationis]
MPKTLKFTQATLNLCLFICLLSKSISGFAQQVKNVPDAFAHISVTPKVFVLSNDIDVPTKNGHFQGVQVINSSGREKLLISGSSSSLAFVLQADLSTQKTEKLIALMDEPFRHAGGIQVSGDYLAVGIEDNIIKTRSKVRLYNYHNDNLAKALPNLNIDREGEAEQQTSGAVALLPLNSHYLMVVSNWDSRIWDFYAVNPEKQEQEILHSFTAPDNWAGYQSINLLRDENAIYAIGFYSKEHISYADLILISDRETYDPIMKKIASKAFNTTNGVDFGSAAGVQVDKEGNLHIWGTQNKASKGIAVNKF